MFGSDRGPPAARDVAQRAIVLRCVVVYARSGPSPGLLKPAMQKWSDEDRRKFAQEREQRSRAIWAPIKSLASKMSPAERELSKTTLLTISERQHIDASWRIEALQVLAWALGLIAKLPPYDAEAQSAFLSLIPADDGGEFSRSASLIERQEIEKAREAAELWHWRSRTRDLIEDGQPWPSTPEAAAIGVTSFDGIVRHTARSLAAEGTLTDVIDDDFPAFGKAYRDLTDDEWSRVRSITMERHFALNWLCGYAPGNRWDKTPTDT